MITEEPPQDPAPVPRPIPLSVLSTAAQLVALTAEEDPASIRAARNVLNLPATDPVKVSAVQSVFGAADTNNDGMVTIADLANSGLATPFANVLYVAAQVEDPTNPTGITQATLLRGNLGYLYSYGAVRDLTSYYCTKPGVANGLSAKISAAEAAESRGDLDAKAGALQAYQNQLQAQTGKTITDSQARTLRALVRTF